MGGAGNDNFENTPPVHQKSDLLVRIISSGNQTKYYDVANIKLVDPGSNAYYEVEIEDKLEEDDVSFLPAFSLGDTSLQLEIAQRQIKSQPEFGGRFFAKIERDGILESAILNHENIDDYRVIANTHVYANSNAPDKSQSYWRNTDKGVYPGGAGTNDTKHGEWFFCRNVYRHYNDARGTLITNGSKYRGGLGGVTSHSNAHTIRGFGARAGNDFLEIAYHWWGSDDRDAWQGYWLNFEFQHKPNYKKLVQALETTNMKFRFTDDPDQNVYQIKGYRRRNIGAFKDGKIGRWGSMRIIKWTLKLDKAIVWAPEDNGHKKKQQLLKWSF